MSTIGSVELEIPLHLFAFFVASVCKLIGIRGRVVSANNL